MQSSNPIKQAYEQAAREQAKYPRLAKLLRDAGVRYYVVDVHTGTTTHYGKLEEKHQGALQQSVATAFSKEKLMQALRDNQAGKTTYPQFLAAASHAGIQTYIADLEHFRVIYIGHGQAYEEAIPQ